MSVADLLKGVKVDRDIADVTLPHLDSMRITWIDREEDGWDGAASHLHLQALSGRSRREPGNAQGR